MNKKQRILLSTLELIVQQGIDVPMSVIAKNANVAVGTIYHYFKDKQHIVNDIYKMIRRDFGSALTVDSDHPTAKGRFTILWKTLYHYYLSNPMAFQFYVYIARPPLIPQSVLEETKISYQAQAYRLKDAAEAKIIKNLPVDVLIRMFHNSVVTMIEIRDNRKIELTEKEMRIAVDAAWDYIKHPNYKE